MSASYKLLLSSARKVVVSMQTISAKGRQGQGQKLKRAIGSYEKYVFRRKRGSGKLQ